MQLRLPAILVSARHSGETAVVVQLLSEEHGLIAAYVAGGRGRSMRPVVIPGNLVEAELTARSAASLPFAKLELNASRGPWLGEPLAAAAIGWACALTARALPERQAYPSLFRAFGALLDAVCHAPSARGWASALVGYEALMLRELGYGGDLRAVGDWPATLAALDRLAPAIDHYLLADRRGDVMAARHRLRDLLGRIE